MRSFDIEDQQAKVRNYAHLNKTIILTAVAAVLSILSCVVAFSALSKSGPPSDAGERGPPGTDSTDAEFSPLMLGESDTYTGAVFFGHMNPDADSVGAAFAAAEFFKGDAACPMKRGKCPNPESRWIMDYFGVPDSKIKELPDIPDVMREGRKFVLVDFNDPGKGPTRSTFDGQEIPMLMGNDNSAWLSPIIGIIDHHALEMKSVRETTMPGYIYEVVGSHGMVVETHAWGSACSIMARRFSTSRRTPSKEAAGLMLGGILSDTLGLQGVNTKQADRDAILYLQPFAQVNDLMTYYNKQAEAKSIAALTFDLVEVLDMDLKTYSVGQDKDGNKYGIAIGAVEVAGAEVYDKFLRKQFDEFIPALKKVQERNVKKDGKKFYYRLLLYIFLVDTKNKRSSVLTAVESSNNGEGDETCVAKWALDQTNGIKLQKECRPEKVQATREGNGPYLWKIDSGTCESRKAHMQPLLVAAGERWMAGKLSCTSAA